MNFPQTKKALFDEGDDFLRAHLLLLLDELVVQVVSEKLRDDVHSSIDLEVLLQLQKPLVLGLLEFGEDEYFEEALLDVLQVFLDEFQAKLLLGALFQDFVGHGKGALLQLLQNLVLFAEVILRGFGQKYFQVQLELQRGGESACRSKASELRLGKVAVFPLQKLLELAH